MPGSPRSPKSHKWGKFSFSMPGSSRSSAHQSIGPSEVSPPAPFSLLTEQTSLYASPNTTQTALTASLPLGPKVDPDTGTATPPVPIQGGLSWSQRTSPISPSSGIKGRRPSLESPSRDSSGDSTSPTAERRKGSLNSLANRMRKASRRFLGKKKAESGESPPSDLSAKDALGDPSIGDTLEDNRDPSEIPPTTRPPTLQLSIPGSPPTTNFLKHAGSVGTKNSAMPSQDMASMMGESSFSAGARTHEFSRDSTVLEPNLRRFATSSEAGSVLPEVPLDDELKWFENPHDDQFHLVPHEPAVAKVYDPVHPEEPESPATGKFPGKYELSSEDSDGDYGGDKTAPRSPEKHRRREASVVVQPPGMNSADENLSIISSATVDTALPSQSANRPAPEGESPILGNRPSPFWGPGRFREETYKNESDGFYKT
ncbi:hypothetical protein HD553DRAFT_356409 [Filobasidium floriforme]|uniref:uncharacterized protein n=1 Tax=Filobasidium floriforme TaxID=5210 RepID=UPI001E8D1AD7|nr:uncharacterized protein HD553DRAFT_356409 [Filobasidium floriforme]KAH8084224.1 hypothetical protein HD553DRAFT_356409 [Filobasidium floriforme]